MAEFIVEEILDHKETDHNRLYLIKWQNYGTKFNSWEPRNCLNNSQELLDQYHNSKGINDIDREMYENQTVLELDKDTNTMTVNQIIIYLNCMRKCKVYKSGILIREQINEQIKIKEEKGICILNLKAHIYVLYSNKKELHVAGGPNEIYRSNQFMEYIKRIIRPRNTRIVKHEFNQQRLVDPCGTSAIAIGLEIMRQHKNG